MSVYFFPSRILKPESGILNPDTRSRATGIFFHTLQAATEIIARVFPVFLSSILAFVPPNGAVSRCGDEKKRNEFKRYNPFPA